MRACVTRVHMHRFLLSPGDQFFVAPGNVYRLQNHSETVACELFWTIIKPLATADSSDEHADEADDEA